MKNLDSPIKYDLERQIIKTGMLFADRFHAISKNIRNLRLHHIRDTMKDKDIIYCYKYYFTDLGVGPPEEDIDQFYKDLTKLRNKKAKTKQELMHLGGMEKNMRILKGDVYTASESWVITNNLESMIGFLEDKSLSILDSIPEENWFQFRLTMFEGLDSPTYYHIKAIYEMNMMQSKSVRDTEPLTDIDHLYTNHLCYLPCLDSLSHNQMKIIRNEFNEKLSEVFDQIYLMQMEFSKEPLTPENINKVGIRFDEVTDIIQPIIQETVDNNIYFQQIKNSSTDHKLYQFNIAFATIKKVMSSYRDYRVITDIEETMFLEKIALTKDINNCCVYFYLGGIIEDN